MKIGDLVTYKQREDLRVSPCPWGRLGIIVDMETAWKNPDDYGCEVYWYGSGNKVWWSKKDLELVAQ